MYMEDNVNDYIMRLPQYEIQLGNTNRCLYVLVSAYAICNCVFCMCLVRMRILIHVVHFGLFRPDQIMKEKKYTHVFVHSTCLYGYAI